MMFGTCKLGFILVAAVALALLSGSEANGVTGDSYAATSEAQQLAEIKALLKLQGKEFLEADALLALLKRPAVNEPLEEDKVEEQPEEEVIVSAPPTEIEEQQPPKQPTHLTIVVGKPQPLRDEEPLHETHEHKHESKPDHENLHQKLDVILAVKGAAAASKKPVVKTGAEVGEVAVKTEREVLHNQIAAEAEAQEIDEIVIIKTRPDLKPIVELVVEERKEHEQQAEEEAEEVPVGIPHKKKVEPAHEVEKPALEPEQEHTVIIIKKKAVLKANAENENEPHTGAEQQHLVHKPYAMKVAKEVKQEELSAAVEEEVEALTKDAEQLLDAKNPVETQQEELLALVEEEVEQLKEDAEEVLVVKRPNVIEENEAEIEETDKLIIEKNHIVKTTVVEEEAAEVETHDEESAKAEQLPHATKEAKDVKVPLHKEEIKYVVEAEEKPENAAKRESEELPFPEILKQLYSGKDQFLFTNMKTKHEKPEKAQHATEVESEGQAEESDEYEIIIKRVLKVKEEKHEDHLVNEEGTVAAEQLSAAYAVNAVQQQKVGVDSNIKIAMEKPAIGSSPKQVKEINDEAEAAKENAEFATQHEKPAVVEMVAVEPVPVEAAPQVPAELIEEPQVEPAVEAVPEHTEDRATCASGADYEPHPKDCSRFVQCNHGYAVDMYCGEGLYWDALTSICDWSNENCFKTKN